MTDDQKITALYEIYMKATDLQNADREIYMQRLDKEQMLGRVMNGIQSYDYLENEKYKKIE